jgi:protein arginine N-methyltransferase 1
VDRPDHRADLTFSVLRSGVGHGIVAWFETCLVDGVGFSNAPGAPEAIYGSMFFPWAHPVSLAEGQNIHVDLDADLVANDYVWRWTTSIDAAGSRPGVRFEQSQFAGAIVSLNKLNRSGSDHVPQLSEDGRVNRRALELIDGKNSLEAIARRLAAEFPQRFARWQQGLPFVAKISGENS